MILFRSEGIKAKQHVPITVHFEEEVAGNYYADILPDRHPAGGLRIKLFQRLNL
jgi:hypothetical protein